MKKIQNLVKLLLVLTVFSYSASVNAMSWWKEALYFVSFGYFYKAEKIAEREIEEAEINRRNAPQQAPRINNQEQDPIRIEDNIRRNRQMIQDLARDKVEKREAAKAKLKQMRIESQQRLQNLPGTRKKNRKQRHSRHFAIF